MLRQHRLGRQPNRRIGPEQHATPPIQIQRYSRKRSESAADTDIKYIFTVECAVVLTHEATSKHQPSAAAAKQASLDCQIQIQKQIQIPIPISIANANCVWP